MKTVMIALYPYQSQGLDAWLDHGFGMTYTAAKQAGCQIDVIDMKSLSNDSELKSKMKGYDLVCFGLKSSYYPIGMKIVKMAKEQGSKVLVAGYHATAAPKELLENPDIDYVLHGESEITFPKFLKDPGSFSREFWGEKPKKLDDLPFMDRSIYRSPIEPCKGWWYGQRYSKMVSVMAARGCAFNCLAGDTIVHTTDGDFKIKDLVGKKGVKILSRNPETQEPIYVDAKIIAKTRENAELVRVHFDDGSHIDCTPDHKFMVFKSKNKYIQEKEWEVEAQYLKPKQSVRAVMFDIAKTGRVAIRTTRTIRKQRARLIMEAISGVKLSDNERIHHIDHNPGNDNPSNLSLTDKNNHVKQYHPEISERMKKNNPSKNMTDEWKEKVRSAITGKKRSIEQRLIYRESKLGEKNPNYKKDPIRRRNHRSRIPAVNHKIVKVEKLEQREDVYCMEVPDTSWFYANKVLVHNCAFCQPLERNHFGHKIRRRSVDNMIAELLELKERYKPDCVMIHDDTFLFNHKWIEEFIDKYPQVGLPFWASGRADGICNYPNHVKGLIEVGWELVSVGFESGSQRILDLIKKGTTVEQNIESAEIIKKFGAAIYGNYMIGLPWETKEDMQATIDMADTIKAEMPSWAFFAPYPGCELGERCIEEGLSLLDRNSYDRCPHTRKCKNVDYEHLGKIMANRKHK